MFRCTATLPEPERMFDDEVECRLRVENGMLVVEGETLGAMIAMPLEDTCSVVTMNRDELCVYKESDLYRAKMPKTQDRWRANLKHLKRLRYSGFFMFHWGDDDSENTVAVQSRMFRGLALHNKRHVTLIVKNAKNVSLEFPSQREAKLFCCLFVRAYAYTSAPAPTPAPVHIADVLQTTSLA